MVIPTEKEMEEPLLVTIYELGGKAKTKDVYKKMTTKFPELTKEDIERRERNGSTVVWWNRIQWVRQKLLSKEELSSAGYGIWAITKKGLERIDKNNVILQGEKTIDLTDINHDNNTQRRKKPKKTVNHRIDIKKIEKFEGKKEDIEPKKPVYFLNENDRVVRYDDYSIFVNRHRRINLTLFNVKHPNSLIQKLIDDIQSGIFQKNANELIDKGIAFYKLKRFEISIKCFDEVLRVDPKNEKALKNKNNAIEKLKRLNESSGIFREERYEGRIKITNQKNIKKWLDTGDTFLRKERFKEAVKCYDEVLKIDPQNFNAWHNKGRALHVVGRLEDALKCYNEALKIDPFDIIVLCNKGFVLYEIGRFEETVKCYNEVLRIDPKNQNALENKNDAIEKLKSLNESLKPMYNSKPNEKIKITKQKNAQEWLSKGISLYRSEKIEDAIKCYDEALKIDPQDVYARKNKDIALDILRKFKESIKSYDKALKINPKNAEAWKKKGSTYKNIGRLEEAIKCFDEALKIDPTDARVWNSKGFNLSTLERFEDAIKCYDEALKMDPEYICALNNKANDLDSLGQFEKAIECYDALLRKDPKDTIILTNKGSALDNLGRHEDAIKCYNEALKIYQKKSSHIEQ
jgi:tetratricopeptide (TPR) repeat protein